MFLKKFLALITSAIVLNFFLPAMGQAMPIGTLLYRSSSNGNLYGYNTSELVSVKNGIIRNIYTGHVAIYVGQENGVHYIVEAMPDGIIKVPASYFLNSQNGEKLIGAKIPKDLTETQRMKVAELAKNIADNNHAYDFSFKKQKGPNSGQWTCVGLVEKIYESANMANPLDLRGLQYDSRFYGVDITADGFDNFSVLSENNGDCLSKNLEFSKIEANNRTILPWPEIYGFNAGLEYQGERYFFFPITQYWQNSLEDVVVDIDLESGFFDKDIRGKAPNLAMIFKWSLINNPVSAINRVIKNISETFSSDKEEFLFDNNERLLDPIIVSPDISEPFFDFSEDDNLDDNEPQIEIISAPNNGNESGQDDNVEEGQEQEQIIEEEDVNQYLPLLIAKVYATGNDDYITIYNPTNQVIDLAEHDIRLYKSKTSTQPSLMMRIGNDNDGVYPGGTTINSNSVYVIARTLASDNIKSQAQAIAGRSKFTFTGRYPKIQTTIPQMAIIG